MENTLKSDPVKHSSIPERLPLLKNPCQDRCWFWEKPLPPQPQSRVSRRRQGWGCAAGAGDGSGCGEGVPGPSTPHHPTRSSSPEERQETLIPQGSQPGRRAREGRNMRAVVTQENPSSMTAGDIFAQKPCALQERCEEFCPGLTWSVWITPSWLPGVNLECVTNTGKALRRRGSWYLF